MKNNKILIACLCGTALEWFDFSLFGALSPILAELFFPKDNSVVSLLKIFIIFASGFLIRPVAALYWGYLGDKIGRKQVVIKIIVMMTFSSMAIGLIPDYHCIGILAPILLVFFRLMQGFSASGEHAGMLTYLYEISSKKEKIIFSNISFIGIFVGMGIANLFAFVMQVFLDQRNLLQWGWRVPFLFSICLGFIGLQLRKKLDESKEFSEHIVSNPLISLKQWIGLLAKNKMQLLKCIGAFQMSVVVSYIIFVYMPATVVQNNPIVSKYIYLITFANLLLSAVFIFLYGYIYKYFKNFFLVASPVLIIFGSLIFLKWFFTSNLWLCFLAQLYFGICNSMFVSVYCYTLAKSFAVNIRFSAIAICLNIAATIFGGLSPLILSLFNLTKHLTLYSILFITASCLLAIGCIIFKEKEIVYEKLF